MSLQCPNTPEFTGLDQPSRVEADTIDLDVEGSLSNTIAGAFIRPHPTQNPPMLGNGCKGRIRL
ncbi:hypothetical protein SJI19_03835 [Acerihabitans sp. TG2]|uniref:hypothetical protein n=1 Tax=Acerihabitans sp. TG2 TaxID=3096008 RepID=UPI002B222818|nr:hypothetical protein [Acerihabitans sp. TG2]MEA9389692.1 hypothetical protein [Acerihabitans sp. TG2]